MRHQAFGVEIELKGLDRGGAARAIARALGGAALGDRVTDPATGRTWKAVRDGSLHGVSAEVVRTTWGRIGTEGRSKEERFEDEAALRAGVEATLQTRLGHGYTVISDSRQGR